MTASNRFTFDFSGEDIDTADNGNPAPSSALENVTEGKDTQDSAEAVVKAWDIQELLSSLPDRISYYTTEISVASNGQTLRIPRRALYDVRVQIMSESNMTALDGCDQELGLGASDIEQNIYEGGFKSWEGAMDLARLLAERDMDTTGDEGSADVVVELGCGTALPSLVLFHRALNACKQHSLTPNSPQHCYTFILADYNAIVLRLVTIPNLLLTWAALCSRAPFSREVVDNTLNESLEGEFTITPDVISAFTEDLARAKIHIELLSGPWCPGLVQQVSVQLGTSNVLLLAAETIYSPASIGAFTDVVSRVLSLGKSSMGLVAAKRLYFGVGGGVEEFIAMAGQAGVDVREMSLHGLGLDEGVGRCVLVVRPKR